MEERGKSSYRKSKSTVFLHDKMYAFLVQHYCVLEQSFLGFCTEYEILGLFSSDLVATPSFAL